MLRIFLPEGSLPCIRTYLFLRVLNNQRFQSRGANISNLKPNRVGITLGSSLSFSTGPVRQEAEADIPLDTSLALSEEKLLQVLGVEAELVSL